MRSYSDESLFLRQDLRWLRGRAVMAGGQCVDLAPLDDALMRCLMGGMNSLDGLAEAMAVAQGGKPVAHWRDRLLNIARQPNGFVRYWRGSGREAPGAVIVQISPNGDDLDGVQIARGLSGKLLVWFVTASQRLAARARRYVRVRSADEFASAFEFLQWVRSLVVRLPQVPVLLCGEADAICVGNAARYGTVVAALSAGWPGGVGAYQLNPGLLTEASREVDGGIECDRRLEEEYMYAALSLRAEDELCDFRRGACGALAVAECNAFQGATGVLFRTIPQAEQLARIGVEPGKSDIVGCDGNPDSLDGRGRERVGFLVLAKWGTEVQMRHIANLAAAVLERGGFRFGALWTGRRWARLEYTEDSVHLLPWAGECPALRSFAVALVLSDMLEEVWVLPRVVTAGCQVVATKPSTAMGAWERHGWTYLEGGPEEWCCAIATRYQNDQGHVDEARVAQWSVCDNLLKLGQRSMEVAGD